MKIIRAHVPMLAAAAGMTVAVACATSGTPFGEAVDSRQWSRADAALNADTSLLHDETTLYQAAMLYSFPNRSTYDPARARTLFERLLAQHPATPMRLKAIDQLSLLYELQRVQNDAKIKREALQSKIASLEADTLDLRRSIDSVAVQIRAEQDQSAILRKVATRLENDLQDRESRLGALHAELDHLKAIDLRPPARPPGGDATLKRPRPL